MSNFVNWTTLYNAMLEKLASGNATIGSVTTAGGKTIAYKSNKEFLEMLKFVEVKAKEEVTPPVTRTYVKDMGRGTLT